MIFVTVGTQLSFDRLLLAVDHWAAKNPAIDVFAQTGPSSQVFGHLRAEPFVSPSRADRLVREASLVVAHAGMGSVLTALRHARPILIMPRHASRGEHRNEHQLATARWLASRPGVTVAWDEIELVRWLDCRDTLVGATGLSSVASGPLVERLSQFIRGDAT